MAVIMENIYKNFGPQNVLMNFNLHMPKGRTTALMGPSGSGKTTAVNILLGLQKPDHGRIAGLPPKVSAVFQEDRLLEHASGLANIQYVVKNHKQHDNKIWQLLVEAGLAGDAHKPAGDYSGGMRRRLCLCRALAADFDFIVLDEAFKGLDAALKAEIMAMTKGRIHGKTALLVTHDADEAAFFGAEIFTL